jgi:hypothetical protein
VATLIACSRPVRRFPLLEIEAKPLADVQRFRVAPVTTTSFARFLGMFPIGWVASLGTVLPLGIGGAGLLIPGFRMPWGVAAVLIAAAFILPAFLVAGIVWSRAGFIEINDTRLVVRGAPDGPSAQLHSLRLREARVVDLSRDRALFPSSGFGLNVPGCFTAGTGLTGRSEHVAWLVTDPCRVVYVPASAGHSVLVSAEAPESLVAALHSLHTESEGAASGATQSEVRS